MVVYYLNKISERLADYRYPIEEGDICMLYDGEVVKTIFIDSEKDADSIWRDFKFVDTKSLKSYHFPKEDSILCAPFGKKHAQGDVNLLTQLSQDCKGEWLLDFLNETSAVLSGFVDYWDLEILKRLIGNVDIEAMYADEEVFAEFIVKPIEEEVDDDDFIGDDNTDCLSISYDIRWFCLSALVCIESQLDKRSYQILEATLKGETRKVIAEKHRLTQERIRQIVVKVTKQAKVLLEAQRKRFEEVSVENARLKVQVDLLKEDVVRLKTLVPKDVQQHQNGSDGNLDEEVAALLETPIKDVGLSARASNILHYMGIKKFADIPQIESVGKLRDMRNSGRKTVHEVSRLLNDFCLTFGMSFTEMVDSLTTNDWQSAKRRWIKGNENNAGIKEQTVNNTEQGTSRKNYTDKENAPYSTHNKKDSRIGYVVKLFPSQQVGVIVNSNVDKKGTKKLVVRTNEGNTMAIDDSPYLYEVLKRNANLETKISKEYHERTKNVASGEATVMLTKEIIEAARTPNGGFTKSQLAAIGVAWPPPQDWIEEKVGAMITPSQLETFNRIEYVSKPLPASFRKSDLTQLQA